MERIMRAIYNKKKEQNSFMTQLLSKSTSIAQTKNQKLSGQTPTKNQLRNQMMTYLKHVGNFKHAELKIKKFEEIQTLYEKIKRSDEDFISIGSAEDERLIKMMNEKGIDSSKNEMVKEESKEEVKEENKEEESTRKRKLDDEDEFWNSHQHWNIVSWKLHDSSGVHTLVTEAGLVIQMLVEKKYPLRKKVLVQMLK
ncbi:hypothetical protein Tco_0139643 [Tanacetum coccineum]